MNAPNTLPLALGLLLFSFLITSILVIPFINLLYKLKLTRRKEALGPGKATLFDQLHDKKAGTPVGGGILLIVLVSSIFLILFPVFRHMGVYIQSSFEFKTEVFLIFFTFISFGLLGLSDDLMKIFGTPQKGKMGFLFGLSRTHKFVFQWVLALFIGYILYAKLGIHIVHVPLFDQTLDFGLAYVPVSAFIIVSFCNAFNITDGLDGLASGLLMICLLAFGFIAAGALDTPLWLFIFVWIGTLMAFLYFNVWPARIFLGDAGSLSFGATLGLIGLLTGSIVALVVIGGIFVIELASSAIQIFGWKVLRRPIFPLAPIHHTFLAIGWEEPKIVTRAWLAGIILAIFGLWLASI